MGRFENNVVHHIEKYQNKILLKKWVYVEENGSLSPGKSFK
jgi:hypothetical protein